MKTESEVLHAARRLGDLAAQLVAVVETETQAMRAHSGPNDPDGLERLALAYRATFEALTRDPERLRALPGDVLDTLKRDGVRLAEALRTHQQVLSAFKDMTEGLAQALVEEVARQRRQAAGYGGDGAGLGAQATARPIAVDRSA